VLSGAFRGDWLTAEASDAGIRRREWFVQMWLVTACPLRHVWVSDTRIRSEA